jgi:hypothetical protein
MREAWSQFEQAWRDTLVHNAEAAAFQPLCRLYGVPRPVGEILEEAWSGVLTTVAFGSRGNFETTFRVTESAFSQLNVKIYGHVDSSAPDVLVSTSQPWPDNIENRYIRKGKNIYFSETKLSQSQLKVVSLKTAYWDAPSEPDAGVNNYVFEVLPFVIHERSPGRIFERDPTIPIPESLEEGQLNFPSEVFTSGDHCLFEVVLFTELIRKPPMTWLQAPSNYSSLETVTTKEGVPFGGAILLEEFERGNPNKSGPYPLYAYDGLVFPLASKTLSSTLAAGVEYRVRLNPPV